MKASRSNAYSFINYQCQSDFFFPNMVHSHLPVFYFSPQLSVWTSQFKKHLAALWGGGEKFRWDKGRGGRDRAGSCCEHWLLSAHLRLMESDTAGTLTQARPHTHTRINNTHQYIHTASKQSRAHRHTRREDFSVSVNWLMMAPPRLHSAQHSCSLCVFAHFSVSMHVCEWAFSLSACMCVFAGICVCVWQFPPVLIRGGY